MNAVEPGIAPASGADVGTGFAPPLPRTAFEGALFPAVPRTEAAMQLALQQQLAESQFWPRPLMRARQFEQIAALVAHIDRSVPFYGVSLRRAGLKAGEPIDEAAWRRVPILERSDIHDHGERLLATEVPASHGGLDEYRTSGTSGIPVRIKHSRLHGLFFQAFQLREELWHRRDIAGKLLAIRRDDRRVDFADGAYLRRMDDWGAPLATVYPTGPSVVLDYRSTIGEQVETLLAERPAYLLVYPSVLLELLRHCRAHGVAFAGLRGVRTLREVVSPELRALCREVLGVGITDIYSCGEAGALALQCPERGAYHLQDEATLVEVLNDDGAPCDPGEVGRVVVTPLHNWAMPLVRYAVGDLAEVGAPCACGRTLPVLARIVGRTRDMVTLPDGSKRYPYYGHNALIDVRAIRQHQMVQLSLSEMELRLVVSQPLTASEEARIRALAVAGLGHPFTITLRYVDEIKRAPSGKFAEFQSCLPG